MTHDPKLVETVARAIFAQSWPNIKWHDKPWPDPMPNGVARAYGQAIAALDTLATLGALVPPGWQAVPVEATDAMRRATYATDSWHAGYAAILAAAPKLGNV